MRQQPTSHWRGLTALILGMLLTGCSAYRADDPVIHGANQYLSTSTTSSTSTTVAPPTATTAAPVATVPLSQASVVISPTGVVAPVLGPLGDGVKVGTPCGNEAVLTSGTGQRDVQVILDPGHGGSEHGAVDPKGEGFTEKVVNLAVAKITEETLTKEGVSVVMTRTGDYRSTLTARARMAQVVQPQAFVSIHHNGESDGPRDGPGSETYYQVASPTSAKSKRLAGLIYEEIVKALSQFSGVPWQADRDAGAKYRLNVRGDDYYAMLRQTKGVTAVLAELAFLSNPPERDLLTRPDVQRAEGEAVARGIVRFLRTEDPGSGYVEPYPRDSPAGSGGGSSGCVDPPLA